MPYALFSNDARLSKAYPTEADVWKHARKSGLVVDAATEENKAAPRPVLDNDYEPAGPAGRSRQEPGRCRARGRAGFAAGFVKARSTSRRTPGEPKASLPPAMPVRPQAPRRPSAGADP